MQFGPGPNGGVKPEGASRGSGTLLTLSGSTTGSGGTAVGSNTSPPAGIVSLQYKKADGTRGDGSKGSKYGVVVPQGAVYLAYMGTPVKKPVGSSTGTKYGMEVKPEDSRPQSVINVTYKKHDDPKAIHAAGATSGAGVVNLTTAAKKNESVVRVGSLQTPEKKDVPASKQHAPRTLTMDEAIKLLQSQGYDIKGAPKSK